jgi:hypothetical protein
MPLGGEEGGFHPADISTTYNSVAGNMTQLNVKAYGESGSIYIRLFATSTS